MDAEVVIVGGGPAGLLLSHLLARARVDSIVLEQRTRAEVEATIRAGVLEQGTVDLLNAVDVGARMMREGTMHHGIVLCIDGRHHRVPLSDLTGGRGIMLYAQHEVTRDLIAARVAAGGGLRFDAKVTSVTGSEGPEPCVHFVQNGESCRLSCRYVVGCDGFSSVVRAAIPRAACVEFQRSYPFGWLGILVEAPRSAPELIYARHTDGFALVSTRSATIQRMYLQCAPGDRPDDWSDDRIWAALRRRLVTVDGWQPVTGPILHKDVVAMRSFVCETMRYGHLLLAGDAAHIVPPTGAKGLNLAVGDVRELAAGLVAEIRHGQGSALATYPARCLSRIWRAQRFSWWMTALLHRFDDATEFERHMQQAELELIAGSRAAATVLAEQYVGLPWPG